MDTVTEELPRNRRKACDLCFAKKIKCDMLEPVCSNCVLYNAECRASIVRSRTKLPRPKPAIQNRQPEGRISSVNSRIGTLEAKLQEILESNKSAHTPEPKANPHEKEAAGHSTTEKRSDYTSWKFDPLQPILYYGPPDENLFLPPIDTIMPVVDHYFNTLNNALPLFGQSSFMRLVTGWYNTRTQKRDRPTWAAILVVIALGLQSQAPGDSNDQNVTPNSKWFDSCMRGAQSVMPELSARDEDLLGIQVILSLALLFKNSSDVRPTSTLLGAAVQLSHRLQLHSNDSAQYFTSEEVEQRSRVFWIMFIIDKNISLTSVTPPMLRDADIDIPLPPGLPSDGVGTIRTKDDHHQINIFRLRVDLASIASNIYRLLLSRHGTKLQDSESQQHVKKLQRMLDNWYARIPETFRMEEVSTTVSETDLIQVTNLYHSYFHCIISANGVYSSRADWMQKIGSLSRAAVQDFSVALMGSRVAPCMEKHKPPLVSGWNHCVNVSRGSMALFQATVPTQSLIWQCSCPHLTALVILLANILMSPTHDLALFDLQYATKSMHFSNQLADVLSSTVYEPLHRLIQELHRNAVSALGGNKVVPMAEVDALEPLSGLQGEMNLFSGEEGFHDLEHFTSGSSEGFDDMLDPFLAEHFLEAAT